MVDDLEEAPCGSGISDFFHKLESFSGGVEVGKVYDWDAFLGACSRVGFFDVRESLRWVNEHTGYRGDARFSETFDTDPGFIELLNLFHTVIGGSSMISSCHVLLDEGVCDPGCAVE